MNNRILTVVATVTLLCTTSGCSGMRNFLFGRGARCGLCSNLRRPLQRLNPLNRQTQVPVAPHSYGPQLGCGMEAGCGTEVGCGMEAGCGMETLSNSCNCGTPTSSYGPAVSNYGGSIDPYFQGTVIDNGQVIDGMPIDGQIIGGGVYGGEVYGGQISDGAWVPRGDTGIYSANKYDTDGHKIISEDPLPPGAIPAN